MKVYQPPLKPLGELWRFRGKVLGLTLLAICAELALHAARSAGVWQPFFWDLYALRFGVLLATCIAAYAVLEIAERVSPIAPIGVLALGFFPLAIGHAAIMRAFGFAFGWIEGEGGSIVFAAEAWALFLLLWGSALLASFYSIRLTREQALHNEASAAAHRARMRAIRYRLNPHFLFNTLNSIGLLALEKRKGEAEALIDRLARFLRASLHEGASGYHTLATEFAQVEDYLKIEHVRFPDRLTTILLLPEELEHSAVPRFLLQPLIELAIGEFVSRSAQPAILKLEAHESGEALIIELGWSTRDMPQAQAAPVRMDYPDLARALPRGFELDAAAHPTGLTLRLRGPLIQFLDAGEEGHAGGSRDPNPSWATLHG